MCSNVDEPRDYHSKGKSDRERKTPYDITYMWNIKYDTSELIYETDRNTDIENRLWLPRGRRARKGRSGSFELACANYAYIEWIKSKSLLYSTGNYIQYLREAIMEKNMKKNL